MMHRAPVTELEVESAKLQIEVLERLGRPVDERLRQLAAATPTPSLSEHTRHLAE